MFTSSWLRDTVERVIRGAAIGASAGWVTQPGFDQIFSIETAKGTASGAVVTLVFCVVGSRIGNRNSAAFVHAESK